MKRFKIENLSEVADAMYSDIITEKGIEAVTFVGHCEDVVLILKYLLVFDETTPCCINIEDVELNGYEKEYYISLDINMNVWCSPAYKYKTGDYFFLETDRLYIANDCNFELLGYVECENDEVYEVTYDSDDECQGEDTNVPEKDSHEIITRVARDKDGRLRGFEKSCNTVENGMHYHSTYSFYSSNEDMLKNMLENFDIKY